MSLRVKIREQAKTFLDLMIAHRTIEYIEAKTDGEKLSKIASLQLAEDSEWVSVDVVSGLLDKAITEIEAKAFRRGVNYWENVVWFDDVRKILLGEGETKHDQI